jgi:hypothetical protein
MIALIAINFFPLAKISFINQDFARLCQQEKYDSFLADHYCSFGSRISAHEKNPVTFYKHKPKCHFDLLRGAYFFYCAQLARKNDIEQNEAGYI